MTLTTAPTILIVPGLRDHVEDHWQTHLERRLPNARAVAPLEADKLSRAARVAALDAALAAIDGPVILVAHSAGVMIAVHWARQATREIHGALLAAPADLDTPMPAGYPRPTRSTRTAGRRYRPGGCRFRASSPRAATIRWRASIASKRWRQGGAAGSSISAKWGT
ncbi:hypothetical protein CSX04_02729 [Burkholderia cepacia]|nr:hypothetical protein CSX04_02729 [Burkholderia cepacia]